MSERPDLNGWMDDADAQANANAESIGDLTETVNKLTERVGMVEALLTSRPAPEPTPEPEPELPTDPGYYADKDGDAWSLFGDKWQVWAESTQKWISSIGLEPADVVPLTKIDGPPEGIPHHPDAPNKPVEPEPKPSPDPVADIPAWPDGVDRIPDLQELLRHDGVTYGVKDIASLNQAIDVAERNRGTRTIILLEPGTYHGSVNRIDGVRDIVIAKHPAMSGQVVLKTKSGDGLWFNQRMQRLHIEGIDLVNDPENRNSYGVRVLGSGTAITMRDVTAQGYRYGFSIEAYRGQRQERLIAHRCHAKDNWPVGLPDTGQGDGHGNRGQGFYIAGMAQRSALVECLAIDNGMERDGALSLLRRDPYSHGVYIQKEQATFDLHLCAAWENAGHGVENRTRNARTTYCVAGANAIGIAHTYAGQLDHNIALYGKDLDVPVHGQTDLERGWGIRAAGQVQHGTNRSYKTKDDSANRAAAMFTESQLRAMYDAVWAGERTLASVYRDIRGRWPEETQR